MWATSGRERNDGQAIGAFLCSWRHRFRSLHSIDCPHQHKDDKCHNNKIKHGEDKYTVVDGGCARDLRLSEGGIRGLGQIDKQIAKVHAAQQQSDRWHDDVIDQRGHDSAECYAEDECHRQFKQVAAHDEVFEFPQHFGSSSLTKKWLWGYGRPTASQASAKPPRQVIDYSCSRRYAVNSTQ